MDVLIVEDQLALGRAAAGLIVEALERDPALVLGVATGSSPLTTYRELIRAHAAGRDFSRVHLVALDEYLGIAATDPASYHSVVSREIAEPLRIPSDRVHVPDGGAADPAAAARAFEETIKDLGGVDLQILGIGRNGHLGFNEPGSLFDSRTRVTDLTATTRADNARFFARPEDVPTHCLTQGLGTIREAARLLLVASGEHKASAVAAGLEGPVTDDCPASILQLHPSVTVILDHAAASGLRSYADPSARTD